MIMIIRDLKLWLLFCPQLTCKNSMKKKEKIGYLNRAARTKKRNSNLFCFAVDGVTPEVHAKIVLELKLHPICWWWCQHSAAAVVNDSNQRLLEQISLQSKLKKQANRCMITIIISDCQSESHPGFTTILSLAIRQNMT